MGLPVCGGRAVYPVYGIRKLEGILTVINEIREAIRLNQVYFITLMKLVGITYAGSSEEAKHGLVDWFYVVTQGGRLVEFGYSVKENGFLYGDDSKEVFRDLGDTGIRTGDEWAYNSPLL